MYKEYILRAGYRLPHYLEAVQVEAVNSNEGGGGDRADWRRPQQTEQRIW